MKKLTAVLVITAATILAVWARASTPAAPPAVRQVEFASLEESLDPLKIAFNKAKGKPRIVALVSAT